MERAAGEEKGKSKEIVEVAEMGEGGNAMEENLGEEVPEKAEKEMKAEETIVEKDQDGDAEEKQDDVREVDGGAQAVQELSSIKVKVSRFDSLDVTDAKMGTLDEADAKATLSSSVDETDAKKIKDFFSKHQEEPPLREHGNEAFLPNTKEEMRMKGELSKEEEELAEMVAINDDDIYPMAGKRMGKCILLENDMFHTGLGLSKRKGSSVDRALIIDSFHQLGFQVEVHQNLTCRDIEGVLEAAGQADHSNAAMIAVVVLSHGNEGIFYGYDGAYPAHKVWQPFTADRCPTLAGKPKLFFIQACQGNRMDKGVEVISGGRTSSDSFASYRTPLHADFLLAHSTVAGYYSWRNTASGSWFIQVLGWALMRNGQSHDLLTILAKVGKVVAREYESNSSRSEFNHKKQTPFIYSTLTHRLFLRQRQQ